MKYCFILRIDIKICIYEKFIGVTLDKTKGTEVWDPDVKSDANDSSHVFRGEHTLLVKQVYFNLFNFLISR